MSRAWSAVLLAAVLVVSTVGVAVVGGGFARASHAQGPNPCTGTVTREPSGTTLFTVQGARAGEKTVAMMVGVAPDGRVRGVHNDTAAGRWWLYDADLVNGSILTATTGDRITIVESTDPATGEQEWTWRLPNVKDAHDVDYLGDGEYVLPDKGDGRNRLVIYNRTTDEVVWQWRFDDHFDRFPKSGGGPYEQDWTHVNDVDEIREGVFLVSVRNFDQVIAIDRESKEILWTLGSDDDHEILNEQHNPDFFTGANGQATVLVADSLNDRVVEYTRSDGEWVQTWAVTGLDEPRDADRLPNGNTLIADRRGHRIVEVTPRGKVVWEFYAPWQPYDVERVGTGDESSGPSARQLGATGTHELTGSAAFSTAEIESCYRFLTGLDRTRLLADAEIPNATRSPDAATAGTDDAARTAASESPTPTWTTVPETTTGAGIGPIASVLAVLLGVALGWAVLRRRR